MLVKVARTGGTVTEVMLEEGATVEDALSSAGLSTGDSERVRLNGRQSELDDEVSNGDIVTVAGKIEGGLN